MSRRLLEPTDEERKNGWTAETLTAYHEQREIETQKALDWQMRPRVRARVQNSKYSRFRR